MALSYYLKPVKIVRDLVHGYINLTKFDLELIDTIPFQRLGDIRQLTCQHVYPAARHTRFEHSLGVLELMRSAVKLLNQNGVIGDPPEDPNYRIISKNLAFNIGVAALLHDVGHCPFSHMGESEFDKQPVREELLKEIQSHEELKGAEALIEHLKGEKKAGAVHEQLSCIVILRKYWDLLSNLKHQEESEEKTEEEAKGKAEKLETDFEFIIRSILGLEYDCPTSDALKENKVKNLLVRLLNSDVFDMDKLDYCMRDSYFTGIGAPTVDRQRLFRNMHLDDQYNLVFTSKAVPALQSMIDARDELYMYVYNHHAVVYSDFLNTYISRRLYHNTLAVACAVDPSLPNKKMDDKTIDETIGENLRTSKAFGLGLLPKSRFFSVDAVAERHYSDSDWLSMLRGVHNTYQEIQSRAKEQRCSATEVLQDRLADIFPTLKNGETPAPDGKEGGGDLPDLAGKLENSMVLIDRFLQRTYLKPWWKTVFEFNSFMAHHFRDDRARAWVGKVICGEKDGAIQADEMRSQIAKHVTGITRKLSEDKNQESVFHDQPLREGEFFIIQRSPRFFTPDTIEKLEIALRSNEILGPPEKINRQVREYYIKTLTNISPQKQYGSIYAQEGFYVFSQQYGEGDGNRQEKYRLLESIFVFVCYELSDHGTQWFVEQFQGTEEKPLSKEERKKNEEASIEEMYKKFIGKAN